MCSEECITNCDHRHNAVSLVESLPDLNKQVLYFLLRFLKVRVGCASSISPSLYFSSCFCSLLLFYMHIPPSLPLPSPFLSPTLIPSSLSPILSSLPFSSPSLSPLLPTRTLSQPRAQTTLRWGWRISPWCGRPTSYAARAMTTRSFFKTLGKKWPFYASY